MKLVLEDLTDAQIESIRALLSTQEDKVQKWKPKGGEWYIKSFAGVRYSSASTSNYREAGLEYQTQKQAEQALKSIRSHARQLAWLAENDDGWVADWSDPDQGKYFVSFDHYIKEHTSSNRSQYEALDTIVMSEQNAKKLSKLLNDGVVKF